MESTEGEKGRYGLGKVEFLLFMYKLLYDIVLVSAIINMNQP